MSIRCYGCFENISEDETICPFCGYNNKAEQDNLAILHHGTILNSKYTVGKVLGIGGFGITYLVWDNNLHVKNAIKEFFPSNFASRDISSRGNTVYSVVENSKYDFQTGLNSFAREASILSHFFNLPGIVSVKDFFYENATAYFVMEYIEGISLKEYLRQHGGRLPYKEVLHIMEPILNSLQIIHANQLLHRDISPENIMISDKEVKLIDFGSARYFENEYDKTMTVILKHGYAPAEQYSRNGKQGEWTDIYSLCATMYRMITGKVPQESIDRVLEDHLVPIRKLDKTVPGYIAEAIEKGLSVQTENRQKKISELYNILYMDKADVRVMKRNKLTSTINKVLAVLITVLTCVVLIILAYFKLINQSIHTNDVEQEIISQVSTEIDSEENQEDTLETQTESDIEKETNSSLKDEWKYAEDEADTSQQLEDQKLIEHTVVVARDGKLTNSSKNITVGEMLSQYTQDNGSWSAYIDSNDQRFALYSGVKDGDKILIQFQVYDDDTFKLIGIEINDEELDEYSKYFKTILEETEA